MHPMENLFFQHVYYWVFFTPAWWDSIRLKLVAGYWHDVIDCCMVQYDVGNHFCANFFNIKMFLYYKSFSFFNFGKEIRHLYCPTKQISDSHRQPNQKDARGTPQSILNQHHLQTSNLIMLKHLQTGSPTTVKADCFWRLPKGCCLLHAVWAALLC